MHQSILTRYHPATDTKGARFSARIKTEQGVLRIWLPYDYGMKVEDNHRMAAQRLVLQLQTLNLLENGTAITGGWLNDDIVWVLN